MEAEAAADPSGRLATQPGELPAEAQKRAEAAALREAPTSPAAAAQERRLATASSAAIRRRRHALRLLGLAQPHVADHVAERLAEIGQPLADVLGIAALRATPSPVQWRGGASVPHR